MPLDIVLVGYNTLPSQRNLTKKHTHTHTHIRTMWWIPFTNQTTSHSPFRWSDPMPSVMGGFVDLRSVNHHPPSDFSFYTCWVSLREFFFGKKWGLGNKILLLKKKLLLQDQRKCQFQFLKEKESNFPSFGFFSKYFQEVAGFHERIPNE